MHFDSSRTKWTYGSGSLGCQRFWRRRDETKKRTETSLIIVMVLLHVLMYVIFYKLFWNLIEVVRILFV